MLLAFRAIAQGVRALARRVRRWDHVRASLRLVVFIRPVSDIVVFVVLLDGFYKNSANCSWCKYLSCIVSTIPRGRLVLCPPRDIDTDTNRLYLEPGRQRLVRQHRHQGRDGPRLTNAECIVTVKFLGWASDLIRSCTTRANKRDRAYIHWQYPGSDIGSCIHI